MSLRDEILELYDSIPEDERVQTFHEDMIAGVELGMVVAIREGDTIRYLHESHATPAQLKIALTPDALATLLQS